MNVRQIIFCACLFLNACGGGSGGAVQTEAAAKVTYKDLAQMCSPDNILAQDSAVSIKKGSLADEKRWVNAYLADRYYWYKYMPELNPNNSRYNMSGASSWVNFAQSMNNYFNDSLNPSFTQSGKKIDEFSFMTANNNWNNYSQGQEHGYGWLLSESGSGTSRKIVVSYVYPTKRENSAHMAGILRGDEIISIDNVVINSVENTPTINQALTPFTTNTRRFLIRRNGVETVFQLVPSTSSLAQAEHKIMDVSGKKWGYLIFHAHVDTAQEPLRAAFADFKNQKIDHLVLDLRYNGGGYIALASAVAHAVAGPEKTKGKTFEELRYSDKRSSENVIIPFYSKDLLGNEISSLSLNRVFVLTTADTCSASEAIINGLRGIDVEVIQIGETTCGKPYGFVPQENCGITYAAMEFEGFNHKGSGSYANGIAPTCIVSDNLSKPLAQTDEPMFAKAITYAAKNSCYSLIASNTFNPVNVSNSFGNMKVIRPTWQNSKIMSTPEQMLVPVAQP